MSNLYNNIRTTLGSQHLVFTNAMGHTVEAMFYEWPILSAGKDSSGNLVPLLVGSTGGMVISAGEAHIGQVGGETFIATSTPTLTVAGSYSTGDYVGPSTAPANFPTVFRTQGQGAILQSIVIADNTTTAAVAMELWLFNATFTAPTDNAAWAISDADLVKCLGVVELPAANWYSNSNGKIFTLTSIGLPLTASGEEVWYALVARGTTPTWASGDLQLTPGFLQD